MIGASIVGLKSDSAWMTNTCALFCLLGLAGILTMTLGVGGYFIFLGKRKFGVNPFSTDIRTLLKTSSTEGAPFFTADLVSKVVAVILVTLGGAWAFQGIDNSELAEMKSMSPAEFMQSERKLHQGGYVEGFFVILVMGLLYLGALKIISYLVRRLLLRKSDASLKGK
jgi:hypothetical protein